MTKLNNKLLTVFLVLGTVFFVAIIYTFITKELLTKDANHKVRFNGVTFIKNEYADIKTVESPVNEDEHSKDFPKNNYNNNCTIELINLSDNLSYAKTNDFNIKVLTNVPEAISSASLNDATLPSSSLDEDYKLKISCNNKVIEEFPLGKMSRFLNLEDKETADTENRDIKLISKDKKLILFLNFTVD